MCDDLKQGPQGGAARAVSISCRFLLALMVGAAVCALPTAPAAAQNPAAQAPVDRAAPSRADTTVREQARSATLLDAPVSRTEYRLGPGDLLVISFFGDVARLHTVGVTPEGTVVVPDFGVADVLGLNLNEAEALIRRLVLRYYRNVEVRVTLAAIREIKVYVVGAVPSPGVRTASTATRASELLPVSEEGVLRRSIVLRRSSGETLVVDLARFRQTGDLAANPTLREGDALIVPGLDERIDVLGRVAFPGTYEFKRGETLAELLSTANGGADFPADAGDTIHVARYTESGSRQLFVFSRAAATASEGQAFVLEPFDAVYVPAVSNYKQQWSAFIQGQVERPGMYPITPGVTSVCDLMAMAGGFTQDAARGQATLRRFRTLLDRTGEENELENIPPEFLRERDRQILQIQARGDDSNVVLDLEQHCTGENGALVPRLEAGDRLIVPRRRDEVIVLGAVGSPGIVRYVPGQPVSYFVNLAGGYTHRADRSDVVVLKAKLGTQVDASEVRAIRAGDTIVVPFREERRFVDRVRDINSLLTPIATLAVTIVALTQYFQ